MRVSASTSKLDALTPTNAPLIVKKKADATPRLLVPIPEDQRAKPLLSTGKMNTSSSTPVLGLNTTAALTGKLGEMKKSSPVLEPITEANLSTIERSAIKIQPLPSPPMLGGPSIKADFSGLEIRNVTFGTPLPFSQAPSREPLGAYAYAGIGIRKASDSPELKQFSGTVLRLSPSSVVYFEEEELGKGSFGVVHEGLLETETSPPKHVAIKYLSADITLDARFDGTADSLFGTDESRFEKTSPSPEKLGSTSLAEKIIGPHEELVNRLRNEYDYLTLFEGNPLFIQCLACCSVSDVSHEEGGIDSKPTTVAMVMEFGGTSLHHHFLQHPESEYDSTKSLPISDVNEYRLRRIDDPTCSVIQQLLNAGIAMSEAKVIHCDLKPHNILIDQHGQIRIADLGSMKSMDGKGEVISTEFTTKWASPEAQLRLPITEKSDVFSMGTIIYEFLTGVSFLRGENIGSISRSLTTDKSPEFALLDAVPGMTSALKTLIQDMLYIECTPLEGTNNAAPRPTFKEALDRFNELAPRLVEDRLPPRDLTTYQNPILPVATESEDALADQHVVYDGPIFRLPEELTYMAEGKKLGRSEDQRISWIDFPRQFTAINLSEELGVGSSGKVKLGTEAPMDDKHVYWENSIQVAVKRASVPVATDTTTAFKNAEAAIRTLQTEFLITKRQGLLGSPYIVQSSQCGYYTGLKVDPNTGPKIHPIIVMEYVGGGTLRPLEAGIDFDNTKDVKLLAYDLQDLGKILTTLSDGNICHCDIKPANILRGDVNLKLADFGTAIEIHQSTDEVIPTTLASHRGSPPYMAPEAWGIIPSDAGGFTRDLENGHFSDRSDIYSMGCVAYEIITGDKYHPNADYHQEQHRTALMENNDITYVQPAIEKMTAKGVPIALKNFIIQMVSIDPKDRPSPADVATFMDDFVATLSS
jgi:serine/threonine protein kinase